jgi:undecaprenyl-diphosphatase
MSEPDLPYQTASSVRPLPALVRRWRTQRRLLVGLGLTALMLVAFAVLLETVLDGEMAAFDSAVLTGLRDLGDPSRPLGPGWLRATFTEITHLGGTVALTITTLAVTGLLLFERKYPAAALVAIAVVGGTLISSLLKLGIDRPRPDLVPHLVEVTSPSFPSGHAMLSAVVYLTLGALLARFEFARPATRLYVMAVAVTMTLAIGFSRVFLGVHWPSDVLAGWCLGSAWAIGCLLAARQLGIRRAARRTPSGEIAPG